MVNNNDRDKACIFRGLSLVFSSNNLELKQTTLKRVSVIETII